LQVTCGTEKQVYVEHADPTEASLDCSEILMFQSWTLDMQEMAHCLR